MNIIEEAFFTLIRSAIWCTEPILPHTLSESEWKEIYAISKEQTVVGIMLDAILKLPDDQKPETKLRIQWIMHLKAIEKQNTKMNGSLCSLVKRLKEEELTAYLLKGQGVAQYYPIPEHRMCGDIDIFFTSQQIDRAIKYFLREGYQINGDNKASHYETTYENFVVEIHRKSATFYTRRLQKKYNEIISTILDSKDDYAIIDGKAIAMFPPMANALQLLSHMLRHIIFSGLGLRQVCDWMLFAYKFHNKLDKEQFIKYTKELQLWETYKISTIIATEYLGLPKEYSLFEPTVKDKRLAKKVFQLIMTYGNFGQYGDHYFANSKPEYIKSYLWKVKNCFRFRRLAKSETWNYPIWQLHSIFKFIKK